MLPRTHIILGALFTLLLWLVSPEIPLIYLFLIFLSSFLIDFDHYVTGAMKINNWNLKKVLRYHEEMQKKEIEERKKGTRKRGDFHLFHTVEFHALIGVFGFYYEPLFYIFIGMIFHSMLDLFSLMYRGIVYRREYFFFNWLRKKI